MVSVTTMVMQLAGLLGTNDINEWEEQFIRSICENESAELTDKQVEKVEQLWSKHFA